MKAVLLAALSLIVAGPSSAQDAGTNMLRMVSPSALPAAPDAGEGVPAAPMPQNFSLFRKNIAAAAQSQFSERNIKKAVIRSPREGVYEVDLNPQAPNKFSNPELAALQDGQVILSYSELLFSSHDKRYGQLLNDTQIYELKDSAGTKRFYQRDENAKNNREISTFEAAGQIATEDFLQSAFSPSLTGEEQAALKRLLKEKDVLPLSISAQVGSWRLRIFDGNSKQIREISIPALTPSCPSTALDYCHLSQALK